jgi:hypothetical protein
MAPLQISHICLATGHGKRGKKRFSNSWIIATYVHLMMFSHIQWLIDAI